MPVNRLEALAQEYSEKKNYPGAIIVLKKIQTQYKATSNPSKLAESYLQEGRVRQLIGDYNSAIELFVKARILYEDKGDKHYLGITNLEIGEVYGKLGDCENALPALWNAELNFKRSKSFSKLKDVYYAEGIVHGSCNNLDSAFYFLNLSLNLQKDTITANYCGLLNNLGALHSKKGETSVALNYYNRALQLFIQIQSELGIAVTKSNIAFLYYKEGKLAQSLELYKVCEALFVKNNDFLYLSNSYEIMASIYEEQSNYKEAHLYLKKLNELELKIQKSEVQHRASELQMKFDILAAQNKVEVLAEKNRSEKFQRWMLIGGLLLSIIIALLVVRNLRVNLKNNKLKRKVLTEEAKQLKLKVDIKSKELEIFALKFIEKNNLLSELMLKIKKLSTKDNSSSEKLKELTMVINSNLSTEKDRREFELQLDKTQQDFFVKIERLDVNLTANEKRLCSLLVIDLKTKDIASILNISTEGVKKSRYRLRKKLGLTQSENMSDYLKSL